MIIDFRNRFNPQNFLRGYIQNSVFLKAFWDSIFKKFSLLKKINTSIYKIWRGSLIQFYIILQYFEA